MRIAVVGSGISGLSAALLLSRKHEVVLFEGNDYLGGHTDTHRVEVDGRMLEVDTGFIVHNPQHYPLLTRLFEELGVATQATTMGFSVQDAGSGLEYNATSLDALFCQRRNLASPRFLGMLRDLVRFYRNAPELLAGDGPGPALGDYLQANGYGDAFRDQHLVPMASALWSSPAVDILRFPARYLVQFMANHHMLQLAGRPEWRVVRGGSRRYVEAMTARWDVQVRLRSPVRAIARDADGAAVRCDAGSERFDQVVLACHSDQALALLEDASYLERDILGAITYQHNDTVLHTDARLLPRNRKAWAAWNAYLPADPATLSDFVSAKERAERNRAHRSGEDPGTHGLRASGLHPRRGRRAGTPARDPGHPPHLVRRCLLGLGFPRRRHPQRGGSRARARRGMARRGRHGNAASEAPAKHGGGRVTSIASAVYEGTVRHRRHAPCAHAFGYRMAQLYLDLDEVDTVFRDRWLWSVERRNLAAFHRRDYLGDPAQPLAEAVRDRVQAATGERPPGPVRLLTHLRYAGLQEGETLGTFLDSLPELLDETIAHITSAEIDAFVQRATASARSAVERYLGCG